MKHICDTLRDYVDATVTGLQGDIIYCTHEVWEQIYLLKSEKKDPM